MYFKEGTQFKLKKARKLAFALKPLVELVLQLLVNIGILTPVDKAEYSTTPLVVVPKPNGAVRLCENFKVSLDPWLNVQQYPMPKVNKVLLTAA